MQPVTLQEFKDARARMGAHVHHTPLLSSSILSARTGFDVRLKAELFQRTAPTRFADRSQVPQLTDEEKRRGVICSSAGNHAQGVALAARIHGIKAVVCMAANATPSKIEATRGYGAEVVLHGSIWDEANERRRRSSPRRATPTSIRSTIAAHDGQGTVGLEISRTGRCRCARRTHRRRRADFGVAMAAKAIKPSIRVIGVESSGAPACSAASQSARSSRSIAWIASSTACA
jgi:threonine dehydratase